MTFLTPGGDMNIRQVVRNFLEDCDCDGLYHPDGDCHCALNEILYCDYLPSLEVCEPGKRGSDGATGDS